MRCQYILREEDMCVRSGTFRVIFLLPNQDRVLIFACNAHAQALGALEWAERKRDADHHHHPD